MHEDRPSIRGKRRSRHRRAGVTFLLVFISFWTLIITIFDVFLIVALVRSEAARTYPTADGTVLECREEQETSQSGSGSGTTYSLHIRYRFEVAGQSYESTRYRYGEISSSDRSRTLTLVSAHPPGSQVTVHYNPSDPHDAVLAVGPDSLLFGIAAFLTPFHIVMFGGWGFLVSQCLASMRSDIIAGIRIRTGNTIVARFMTIPPWLAAMTGTMIFAFPGAVVVLMSSTSTLQSDDALLRTLVYWGLTATVGLLVYVVTRLRVQQGVHDLVIDLQRRAVRLPKVQDIENRDLSLSQITALRTSNDPNRKFNGRSYTSLDLHWNEANRERFVRLKSWASEHDAEEFRDWLAPLILENGEPIPNQGAETPKH